ncbi:plasma membrane-associated cation-binding protein 2-like [Pyrus communis]|uniref:plasma membrane-associated cation-binding protein 2-like n=1 Tax=Pyrus communis TaxID=23211 RepID=UPI0035C23FA1
MDKKKMPLKKKKRTRTLVKNIRNRDDRKANVLLKFAYVPVQKKPKKKAKYIYVVSDNESPSIVISQLEQIFERENDKQIVEEEEEEERPIAETEKHKPMVETQKKKPMVETEKKKKKPIVDKTKEEPKVEKAKPIAKETKRKPAKKTNAKSSEIDKGSYLPATTKAYKFLDDETR